MCPRIYQFNHFPFNYELICPELGQTQRLAQYRCTSHSFFEKKNDVWLWNAFAKRVENAQRVQTFHPQARSGGKLSLLEALPTELFEEILDVFLHNQTDNPGALEDVILLGLSSDVLWPKVLYRIHRDYNREPLISWAGKNVGYHGYYANFSENQIKRYTMDPNPYMNFNVRRRCLSSVSNQPESKWLTTATLIRAVDKQFSQKEWDQIEQDLSQGYFYPEDQNWVLRNLTTKQFIRSDKLAPPQKAVAEGEKHASRRLSLKTAWKVMIRKEKRATGIEYLDEQAKQDDENDNEKPLTLAQVFLVLTCYSDAYSTPHPESQFFFQQGPWSSHAFDIVPLKEHMASTNVHTTPPSITGKAKVNDIVEEDAPWTDVTEVAKADVASVRKCILGFEETMGVQRPSKSMRRSTQYWDEIQKERAIHRAWIDMKVFEC